MDFRQLLNHYIEVLGCTAKELSEVSGLSTTDISRYRTGKRLPSHNSEKLQKLSFGIAEMAHLQQKADFSQQEVFDALRNALPTSSDEFYHTIDNLNTLIDTLNINVAEMSRAINYDASYISRIRSKQRQPSDTEAFIDCVCNFIVGRYTSEHSLITLSILMNCEQERLMTEKTYLSTIKDWLTTQKETEETDVHNFLKKLDEFNLDEYIRAIHFNEIKVPTVPFQFPTKKHYFGVEEMKAGELDFLKSTVLSKSNEPVFMCSDMPMEDMAEDMDFSKKWMMGLAVMLKKGLHLNIIHNLDRPFNEMMLGLESWIPLYMTGQISPYYLKNVSTDVYHHFHYTSGEAALFGECINGAHDKGRYYLTRNKDEVAHFKEYTDCLLQKATPLMHIYRKENRSAFDSFLFADARTSGNHHNILSSLPLYTMPEDLLDRICTGHKIPAEQMMQIKEHARTQREKMDQLLKQSWVFDEVPNLTEAEFAQYPMTLSLSGMFYETDIVYTYEEYKMHLEATKEFAEEHSHYTINPTPELPFRNIQISMHENEWVMVSKNKFPTVHFVIHHPKMCDAFENMVVAVTD